MYKPENFIHRETFRIRTYEINQQKVISVPALVRLMQEAAMQHVLKLKLSVWDLEPLHLAWVLIRIQLKVNRYPELDEQISIETYPSGFEKVFTHRDYRVYDAQGKQIAAASSTWLLMNTQERKMSRIPDSFLAFNKLLPDPATFLPKASAKLPLVETVDLTKAFSVQWHQLDFNLHLNNTFYVQWMLEALPEEVLMWGLLKEMDLLYRTECHWQDEVVSETQTVAPGIFLHRLRRLSDNQELALGRSKWNR